MPHYVMLMKSTDHGLRAAKDIPARIGEGIKSWEALGGTTPSLHVTMGPYDDVAVVDAPNDEVGAAYALGLASHGNVTTLSVKAFTLRTSAPSSPSFPDRG